MFSYGAPKNKSSGLLGVIFWRDPFEHLTRKEGKSISCIHSTLTIAHPAFKKSNLNVKQDIIQNAACVSNAV